MLESSQDLCWINEELKCWFVEGEPPKFYSIADFDEESGAGEPKAETLEDSDSELSSTVMKVLSVERYRLIFMIVADDLTLRSTSRAMSAWHDAAMWKWHALHFRAALAKLQRVLYGELHEC